MPERGRSRGTVPGLIGVALLGPFVAGGPAPGDAATAQAGGDGASHAEPPPSPAPGARVRAWDPAYMPASSDRPATEATCALFPPWEQEGVWALRAPETVRSDHGLLYVDWEHSLRVPILAVLDPPRWVPTAAGDGLRFECRLEQGVRFSVEIVEREQELVIQGRLVNESPMDLSNLETQFCLVHNGVRDFEDPRAERTFVRMDGAFVPLGTTGGELPGEADPAYIVSYTPGEVREPPQPANSWLTPGPADLPLIVTRAEDGERWVAIAFDNVFKLMTNCLIPCIHADPRFPDCASGESVAFEGRVYFGEGPLESLLPRFQRDFPDWDAAGH